MSRIWDKLEEAHVSTGIKNGYPYSNFLLFWKFVDGVVRDKLITNDILSENMGIEMFTDDILLSNRPAFSKGRFRKNCSRSKSVYKSMMTFWFKVLFDSENPYVIRKTVDNDLSLHLKVGKKVSNCIDMLIGFLDEVPEHIYNYLHEQSFHALIQDGIGCFVIFGPMSYIQHSCDPDFGFTQRLIIGDLPHKPPSTEYRLSDKSGFKKVIKLKVVVRDNVQDLKAAVKRKTNNVYASERLMTACYRTKKESLGFDCKCKSCASSVFATTSKKRKNEVD
jgi:hypothetical protein